MPKYLSIPLGLLLIVGVLTGIGWIIFRTIARSDDPAKMLGKWILTFVILGLAGFATIKEVGFNIGGAFVVPFICVAIGVIMSVLWAPHIGAFLAKPITSLFDGGDLEVEPQPLYSIAIAKRKRGQYVEAIYRIREQLEKFPNDVHGQLMLAEILAEDMDDLPGAELTIQRLVEQPHHAPESIAMALNQLADWHLKYGRDLAAASQALQQIIDRFPGSEPGQLAHQRLAHLGRSDRRIQDRGPIRVTAGQDDIGLMQDSSMLRAVEENPAAKAQEYVQHLEQFPQDAEIREKLAIIYAEHYKRLDLALAQLEELLQQQGQPTKLMAGWLNLMADLQVKYGDDYEGARQTLDRIVELYPGSAHAEKARQRMHYLRLTLKAKQVTDPIKLGSYESDLGLKAKINPTDRPS